MYTHFRLFFYTQRKIWAKFLCARRQLSNCIVALASNLGLEDGAKSSQSSSPTTSKESTKVNNKLEIFSQVCYSVFTKLHAYCTSSLILAIVSNSIWQWLYMQACWSPAAQMDFAHRRLTNLAHSCDTITQVQTIANIRQTSIIVDHLELENGLYNEFVDFSQKQKTAKPK